MICPPCLHIKNQRIVSAASRAVRREKMGDELVDDYVIDDPNEEAPAVRPKKSVDPHGVDAVPTTKRAKTAKRKREIEADADHPMVSWLTSCQPPSTAEAIARMERLSGGPPLPLLDAAPSRASLRGLAPGSVLVLCSSAMRCVEVIRALKATLRCSVAKLFAKHLKLAEQLEELKELTPAVMVGTAHRAAQLLGATQPGALRARVAAARTMVEYRSLLMKSHPMVKPSGFIHSSMSVISCADE